MKKLRGAVVGVGYLGNFHAQKVLQNPRAELVGVFDACKSQAEKIASELKTKAFLNLQDMAATVDFVTIAAATQAHFELAQFFLDRKIPVLVEKPIAATAALGRQLVDLAEKNKVPFSVGHIERFNPAYQVLKNSADETTYLELNRLAPFRVRGSDVSVLHDLMIHDIDLVHFLFGEDIAEFMIFGQSLIRPTIDDVSVRLRLLSGRQVSIQNSRLCPQIIRNYRAVQKTKTILMNTATLEGEVLYSDPSHESLMKIEKITVAKADALALEIDHFISAVLGEKPVAITGEEAVLALTRVENFIEQIQKTSMGQKSAARGAVL